MFLSYFLFSFIKLLLLLLHFTTSPPLTPTYLSKDLTTGEMSLLYVDPFSCEDKIAATWFETGRERCDLTNSTPLGYLNCSFAPSPALPGSPVLLSFEDVSDLFFEMGMALKEMKT